MVDLGDCRPVSRVREILYPKEIGTEKYSPVQTLKTTIYSLGASVKATMLLICAQTYVSYSNESLAAAFRRLLLTVG